MSKLYQHGLIKKERKIISFHSTLDTEQDKLRLIFGWPKVEKNIYMVRSKARQHFQVSNVKKRFFAGDGTIKVCICVSKQRMFLSDQDHTT